MVLKKSEYQKQYKACIIKKHQAAYLENLNLRHQRRDREFLHTPICWDEVSEEDEKLSSDCSEEEQSKPAKIQAQKEPEYQSLADILSDSRRKGESARKQTYREGCKRPSDIANGITDEGKQLNSADVPTKPYDREEKKTNEAGSLNNTAKKEYVAMKSNVLNDPVTDENRRSNKPALTSAVVPDGNNRDISEARSHDIGTAGGLLTVDAQLSALNKRTKTKKKRSKELEGINKIKPSSVVDRHCYSSRPSSIAADSFVPQLSYLPRVRKPHSQLHIPRAKSTPVSPEPQLQERPLFLSYGNADREDNLATHRTHNVRAPVDVYPQALRAQCRHQEQHRKQVEKIHQAGSTEAMLERLSAPAPDLAGWESEYRKQFHGYQPRDYERAVASHAVIPRSSSVRAVHRDRHCYSSRPSSIAADSFVPQLSYLPKVRKPHSQLHIPRAKSTPVSPEPQLQERPLFLSYGNGDREDNMATHRTHNVRSPVDVYPQALRAQCRHQEQHRKQVEKIHQAGSTEAMLERLSAPAPDLAGWESEYRKQFHGYQPRDYERAVASHAVIPRSSSVRAVHRGGCLLVHVD